MNAKRQRGWVPTAIHGDRKRGTGILNNRLYIGEIVWGRSTWKRSAADSKKRRWSLVTDDSQVVKQSDERLRIIPQDLWNAVKTRQRQIENVTVRLRGVLKRNGRLPRYVLSGLLTCAECGGTFRCVNGREYGCASHRDGGSAACTNDIRIPIEVAERKLLGELANEMLSEEGVELFERRVRALETAPKTPPKRVSAQLAKVETEIAQLRQLMKAGTLSDAVAHAAIEKAEETRRALSQAEQPERQEKQIASVLRMLPNAARVLRERIGGGNLGLRDPRSIIEARNTRFNLFSGKVPLRRAELKPGEKPYLIGRVGLTRGVLLEAAASCVKSGSGGRI